MKIPKLNTESHWISLSDMMTGLMIIFLFVAVSYMSKIQKTQKRTEELTEKYVNMRDSLRKDLQSVVNAVFKKEDALVGQDLTVKFTKPDLCFNLGEEWLLQSFKDDLYKFIPFFLDLINNPKYQNTIAEVRIEGHTDPSPAANLDPNPYIANVILSQKRATNVLIFLYNHPKFTELPEAKKERLRFLLNATGYSYGRAIDDERRFTFYTRQPLNPTASRRVEFKIVTTSEELVNDIANLKNK